MRIAHAPLMHRLRLEIANPRALALGLAFIVVIVWQVPHVLFLRYTIIVVLGVLFWPAGWRALRLSAPYGGLDRSARAPFFAYVAFLAWLLAVSVAVSEQPLQSLQELRAEWLPTTLILLLGFGLGVRFASEETRRGNAAVRVVFWALVAHAVLQLAAAAVTFFTASAFPVLNFGGISDHKSNVTYTSTLALAFLLADVAAAPSRDGSYFGLGRKGQLAVFAVLLASTIVSATRNGFIVFLLLTLVGGWLIAQRHRSHASPRWWLTFGACVAFTLAAAAIGLKADARWSGFLATVPVAWDTEHQRAWLEGERNETNLPLTATGKPVEPSAYYRVAYLKEGTELLLEHPWGTEIGRDTFNRLIHAKYGTAGMSHAHNGLIDLGLSAGIPGMLLWLGVLGAFAAVGLRAWRSRQDPLGLALFLCVLGFAARMLLDSTLRDHVIEEFALVAGLLAGAMSLDASARKVE
jgi:O-antigen ligase/polysaccharide polymerase Wzy-like membrane protein